MRESDGASLSESEKDELKNLPGGLPAGYCTDHEKNRLEKERNKAGYQRMARRGSFGTLIPHRTNGL